MHSSKLITTTSFNKAGSPLAAYCLLAALGASGRARSRGRAPAGLGGVEGGQSCPLLLVQKGAWVGTWWGQRLSVLLKDVVVIEL